MKEVAELDQELSIEERNLLSVAYKNIIVSYPFGYSLSLFFSLSCSSSLLFFLPRTHAHTFGSLYARSLVWMCSLADGQSHISTTMVVE